MAAPGTGLCAPWATEADLCSPCLADAYSVDFSSYLVQASELLYQLSGQQFPGLCTETIEPCSPDFGPYPPPIQYEPAILIPLRRSLSLESPFPWGGCGCSAGPRTCSCSNHSAIQLPRKDITEVTEVIVDGVELDLADYELQGDLLVRLDDLHWPCCDDTFRITYTYGTEPPTSGIQAAAVLACELLLACDPSAIPDAKCRLPRNISSISRQGVSVIFATLVSTGPFRFGILEIDLFLEAYNRYGVQGPSFIASPDTINQARRIP